MGVLNSFLPGGEEFAHQKNCPGVLSGGGGGGEWSGLELTHNKISKLAFQQWWYLSGLGVGVVVTGWCKLKVGAQVEIYTKCFFMNDFYFSFVSPNEWTSVI